MTTPILAAAYANGVKVTTSTTGTGSPIALGSAVAGFFGAGAALGIADGVICKYTIIGNAGGLEVGWGVPGSSGTTLTRNVVKSTAGGTTPLTLVGGEQVIVGDLLGEDIYKLQPFSNMVNRPLATAILDEIDLLDAYSAADAGDYGPAINRLFAAALTSTGPRGQLLGVLIRLNNLGVINIATQALLDLNAIGLAQFELEGYGTTITTTGAIGAFKFQRIGAANGGVTVRGLLFDSRGNSSQTECIDCAGASHMSFPDVVIIPDGSVSSTWCGIRLRQYDPANADTASLWCDLANLKVRGTTNPAFAPMGVRCEGANNDLNLGDAWFSNIQYPIYIVRPQGAGATHDLINSIKCRPGFSCEGFTNAFQVDGESGQYGVYGLQIRGRFENGGYLLSMEGATLDPKQPPTLSDMCLLQNVGGATFTGSMSGNTLTVTDITTSPNTGRIYKGMTIAGAGVTPCTVTGMGTGKGGTGTYTVSVSQTVGSEVMTATAPTTGPGANLVYNPAGLRFSKSELGYAVNVTPDLSFNYGGHIFVTGDAAQAAVAALAADTIQFETGSSVNNQRYMQISGLHGPTGVWSTLTSLGGAIWNALGLKGIGQTVGTPSYNLAGVSGALSSGSVTVTFAYTEPNANYRVVVSPNAAITAPARVTSKTTTGFSIVTADVTSTATFDWIKVQD